MKSLKRTCVRKRLKKQGFAKAKVGESRGAEAVKNYLIPSGNYKENLEWLAYAEEADVLNCIFRKHGIG